MLKKILNKFLILHDVRGVIVIREDGGIVQSIKSGMEYDEGFMAAVSTLMVGSKATADTFGNSPPFMVFMEFPHNRLLLAPLKEEPQYLSDYYVEDASFLRMDNISLSYRFDYKNQPLRVFLSMQNAFTLTGYSGVDPTAGLNGIDNNIYPRSRQFTGGLTFQF